VRIELQRQFQSSSSDAAAAGAVQRSVDWRAPNVCACLALSLIVALERPATTHRLDSAMFIYHNCREQAITLKTSVPANECNGISRQSPAGGKLEAHALKAFCILRFR
jgi:hypothetical protein